MNKTKVLVFHRNIAPYRIDFFNDLYNAFDTNIALYYHNLKNQKFSEEELSAKLNFKPDFFSHSLKIFGREIPIGFIRRLKSYGPDIVIVNEYSESYWISMLYKLVFRKKYKIITICDDSLDIINKNTGVHSITRKLALKNIDGVILCNYLAEEKYRSVFPNVNTFVMPIIQNEENFFDNKLEIIRRCKELIKEENLIGKRVYLYVGRISPEKNTFYLVQSFVNAHKKNKENILYIIGDNTYKNQKYNERIEKFIDDNKAEEYIRKIGRKDGNELKSWFYLGQVLVLPSISESFGAVTNEALICGNYVMISSVAGSTCLIDQDNGEILNVFDGDINFDDMNSKVPVLGFDYIDNKESKMTASYNTYIHSLINWINTL